MDDDKNNSGTNVNKKEKGTEKYAVKNYLNLMIIKTAY